MAQTIITPADDYAGLDIWIAQHKIKRLLLVCDDSLCFLPAIRGKLEELGQKGVDLVSFSDFQPNPRYESVLAGVRAFRSNRCGGLIAIGGGSAMDVAKCIKLYARMKGDGEEGAFLQTPIRANRIPFLAMPTTAGTGSEATRYAVIYHGGKKQSVTHESCIPGTVLMDPSVLNSLPLYQRKATMMDALCHGVESFWSVNSTEESKKYAREAVTGVLAHMEGYLQNTPEGNAGMLAAAHAAGKAINITQTTAGHAMCYTLTSLFHVAHGHAAILCDRVLFPWMLRHTHRCIDPRGEAYLKETLEEIGRALGGRDAREGAKTLARIFDSLELPVPAATEEQYALLKAGVNPVRLKNHPVALDGETIDALYHEILR